MGPVGALSGSAERDADGVGGVAAVLAALIVGTLALDPLVKLSFSDGSVSITWTMIFLGLAAANAVIGRVSGRSRVGRGSYMFRLALAASFLALPPTLYSTAGAAALLACLNFLVGVWSGYFVGRAWATLDLSKVTVIDLGVYVFIISSCAQLLSGFGDAAGIAHFHQNASTVWGNSNYVAGALVVMGLLVIARSRWQSSHRLVPYLVACVGFAGAVLTLSRGGVIALGVGLVAMVWLLPRTGLGKVVGRASAIALVVVAVWVLDLIQNQRATVNGQVYQNYDERLVLYRAAWQSFLNSPIWGTGWASLRTATEGSTFAHNIFLSLAQIGGLLFGVGLLVILATILIRAGVRWRAALPAILAAAAFAQTDPFPEGTVGGMLIWMTATLAATVPLGYLGRSRANSRDTLVPSTLGVGMRESPPARSPRVFPAR